MKEFRKILPSYELITMREAGFLEAIEETGKTFEANALIKARAVMHATGKTAIADDSGLSVDALSGAPGIYSARYAGEEANDEKNIEKLLFEMRAVPEKERGAAFVSVIADVTPEGAEQVFRGECRGTITLSPHGTNGFGYDPVFFLPQYGKTFGELSPDIKNEISHRSRALAKFRAYLEE